MSEIEENFAYLRDVLGVKYLPLLGPVPDARLMFVGEGLGPATEPVGVLLSKMIEAMGIPRNDVHIAETSESTSQEIENIDPEMVIALGVRASQILLLTKDDIESLRGSIHQCNGRKVIVTFHPSQLLQTPANKKLAWSDLQFAMRELGL